jgi:hypothetical protein
LERWSDNCVKFEKRTLQLSTRIGSNLTDELLWNCPDPL